MKEPYTIARPSLPHVRERFKIQIGITPIVQLAWQYRFNVLYTREKLLEADVPVSLPDTFRVISSHSSDCQVTYELQGTTESNVLFLRDTGVSTPMKPIPPVPYTTGNPIGSRYRIVKM